MTVPASPPAHIPAIDALPGVPQSGERLAWTVLRIAAAMCYVGHGAFGVIGKKDWLPLLAVGGIGPDLGWKLMPIIGALDIAIGLSVLISPRRVVLAYMAVWALWTASLRPLAGLPMWEMLERAGNYGVPLAMLLWAGLGRSARGWVGPIHLRPLGERAATITRVLAMTTGLLLIGHGALAVTAKPLLLRHLALLGLGPSAVLVQGGFEIALGLASILRPTRGTLLAAAGWKIGTELLFLLAGAPVWEFIERGGSYGAPLALALLLGAWRAATRSAPLAARAG